MKILTCYQHKARSAFFVAASIIALGSTLQAADARRNPTGKFFVADTEGSASINTGEKIIDLIKKSVHLAEGSVIETESNAHNSIVLSNGTALTLDPLTRIEVTHFRQEPFNPNRTDLDTEPSISHTEIFIVRGRVGICTSKLVAGSTMVYRTRLVEVSVRNCRVLVDTNDSRTLVSLLEGDITIRSGVNSIGQSIKAGQQAVLRSFKYNKSPSKT